MVAKLFQAGVLGLVEQIHRRQRVGGFGGHRGQDPLQAADQRLDGRGVEHVGAEFHPSADAGGLPALGPPFGQGEHQVHAGRLVLDGHGGHLEVTQRQAGGGVVVAGEVLPGQHHLHQRVMGQAPGGVDPLDQHLERHVLMFERGQALGLDPVQQFGEAGIAGQVDAEDQGVDEEAHQLIERGVAPPGDREAHRHIGTRADLRQQHGQGGLHHHEAGRVVLAGHPAHLLLQLGRPVDHHAVAALIGHRRVGAIGGQLEPLGHAGQGALPVRQLSADAAVAVVEVAELGALPQRVVDVLHRQVGPVGRAPGGPAGVGQAQVGAQRRQRHAVRGDVVYRDHEQVLVLGDGEKPCPNRDFGRQIEGVASYRLDGVVQPARRPRGGIDDLPAEFGALGGHDLLPGRAFVRREQGAQALMTAHHVGQRGAERVRVEPPAQPQGRRHVVQR
ncbi:hypothetical protein MINTM019_27400 [Mycobacterium paraintracellulare]|nr:hypothetical protein MINTM019_27400 [Mycobacterium paraintracellulare]